MSEIKRKTQVIEGVAPHAIPFDDLMGADRPAILKGVARDWPLARAGLQSAEAAVAYLKKFQTDKPVLALIAPAEIKGRYGYDEAVTAMNYKTERGPLGPYLDRILAEADDPNAPSCYIGSTDLDTYLPGFRAENELALNHPMFEANKPMVSIWLGNRTTALAHHDMSNNIACCQVGKRRFTLFPPEQVTNLYPGPLEPTPGGPVITMTDIYNPDFEKHPRLRDALAVAEVAELEPGDVLFYPALWWHQVEALSPFNAMVNYWWNTTPAYIDTPQNALMHAVLSLRDRPEHEKRGWKALFDYYVFGSPDLPRAHLPEAAQGNLAPMDDVRARRLRAFLINRLNR